MLGKLYVSPTSTAEKLHAAHELLADAIEGRVASDAPSRNAMNKLLMALTKAIGSSGAASTSTTATVSATATTAKTGADEGHGNVTMCEDGVTGMDAEEKEEEVEVEKMEGVDGGEMRDSVLNEAEAAEEL